VAEHQRRTVASVAQLRALAPDLWFIPVLQGYTTAEYLTCADLYAAAGIDLAAEPLVGLGSVCRRQATSEAHQIITALPSPRGRTPPAWSSAAPSSAAASPACWTSWKAPATPR
jgi:hypothetical protein